MKITIIGLGLIGGSIGLALKKYNKKDIVVTGYVHRPGLGDLALKVGAIDNYETEICKAVYKADIVFISVPISAVRNVFREISPYVSPDCIVTDTASTKTEVMQWASECLNENTIFIGGHPMAGKEVSGIEASEADLFNECAYCIIKSQHCSEQSINTFSRLVCNLGAKPIMMEAQEHDELVAGISHLPLLLSIALVDITAKNPKWNKMSVLASSGFRDMSRLAAGNTEINYDLFLTNKNAIVTWLNSYCQELDDIRSLILKDNANLFNLLKYTREMRMEWQAKRYSEK